MRRTKRSASTIEAHRQRIRTSQLVNRLASHALGKLKKPMEDSQVRAALGLLKKTLPDLNATELTGELQTRAVVSDQPPTEDEWQRQYGDSLAPTVRASESVN